MGETPEGTGFTPSPAGCATVAATGCVAGAVVACVALVVVLFVVKFLWSWTVPDLFPGAVEQGLIAPDITWLTAFKVAVFAAVLAGIAGIGRGQSSSD